MNNSIIVYTDHYEDADRNWIINCSNITRIELDDYQGIIQCYMIDGSEVSMLFDYIDELSRAVYLYLCDFMNSETIKTFRLDSQEGVIGSDVFRNKYLNVDEDE